MKLTELNPEFCGGGGEGVYNADMTPAMPRHGVGLLCNCPCGCNHQLYVPFANPIDGSPPLEPAYGWQRTGETFETLTLTPSILRGTARGGCGWHGFITNGEVITC